MLATLTALVAMMNDGTAILVSLEGVPCEEDIDRLSAFSAIDNYLQVIAAVNNVKILSIRSELLPTSSPLELDRLDLSIHTRSHRRRVRYDEIVTTRFPHAAYVQQIHQGFQFFRTAMKYSRRAFEHHCAALRNECTAFCRSRNYPVQEQTITYTSHKEMHEDPGRVVRELASNFGNAMEAVVGRAIIVNESKSLEEVGAHGGPAAEAPMEIVRSPRQRSQLMQDLEQLGDSVADAIHWFTHSSSAFKNNSHAAKELEHLLNHRQVWLAAASSKLCCL